MHKGMLSHCKRAMELLDAANGEACTVRHALWTWWSVQLGAKMAAIAKVRQYICRWGRRTPSPPSAGAARGRCEAGL